MTTEISVMYGSEKVKVPGIQFWTTKYQLPVGKNCNNLMFLTFSLAYMTEISVVIRQWT